MFERIHRRNKLFGMFPMLADLHQAWQLALSYKYWKVSGLPVPAPHPVKRALLLREALRIKARCFVETGTFTGDTVWFMRDRIPKVYSIEVQPQLASLARELYANDPGVEIIEGDSATALARLTPRLTGNTLFWLDGHYSAGVTGRGAKDCPVFEELQAIADHQPEEFSIVIDDRRCFGTDPAYPSYEDLVACLRSLFPSIRIQDELDMIWCADAAKD